MNQALKSNLLSGKHWLRLVFMVFFAICLYVASFVVTVVIAIQFLFALITGSDNRNLRCLGESLTSYISQGLHFLTYNSDDKPFPFAEWPAASDAPSEEAVVLEGDVTPADDGDPTDAVDNDAAKDAATEAAQVIEEDTKKDK